MLFDTPESKRADFDDMEVVLVRASPRRLCIPDDPE
jgi:hypothetical protein